MLKGGTLVGFLVLAGLVGAIPANADHVSVSASVTIRQGDKEVAFYSADTGCSATDCEVVVRMPKRDVGRVSRWCGTSSMVITLDSSLPANTGVGPEACSGGGSWFATILASHSGLHAEDVSVQVTVLPLL